MFQSMFEDVKEPVLRWSVKEPDQKCWMEAENTFLNAYL